MPHQSFQRRFCVGMHVGVANIGDQDFVYFGCMKILRTRQKMLVQSKLRDNNVFETNCMFIIFKY